MNSKVARFENLGRSQKFNLQRIQDFELGEVSSMLQGLVRQILQMLIYKHTFVEDEFHYLFKCDYFNEKRKTCILVNNRNCTLPCDSNSVFLFLLLCLQTFYYYFVLFCMYYHCYFQCMLVHNSHLSTSFFTLTCIILPCFICYILPCIFRFYLNKDLYKSLILTSIYVVRDSSAVRRLLWTCCSRFLCRPTAFMHYVLILLCIILIKLVCLCMIVG